MISKALTFPGWPLRPQGHDSVQLEDKGPYQSQVNFSKDKWRELNYMKFEVPFNLLEFSISFPVSPFHISNLTTQNAVAARVGVAFII